MVSPHMADGRAFSMLRKVRGGASQARGILAGRSGARQMGSPGRARRQDAHPCRQAGRQAANTTTDLPTQPHRPRRARGCDHSAAGRGGDIAGMKRRGLGQR